MSLLRLSDWTPDQVEELFARALTLADRPGEELAGRAFVLFFPPTSLRTRVAFERAVHLGGGHAMLFPSQTLDKAEELRDVAGYLANWVDAVVVRHARIDVLEQLAQTLPVVNAMTDVNHPCEVLSDLFALSRLRQDYRTLRYVFVGAAENIGLAWSEARQTLGLDLVQACPPGYEIDGVPVLHDLAEALVDADVVLTDAVGHLGSAFTPFRVTAASLAACAPGVLVNPCPPFTRGAEVTADVIDSSAFVGYDFKKTLVPVQRAVLGSVLQP